MPSTALTFALGCDPVPSSCATIKLWGNDAPEAISVAGWSAEEGFGRVIFPNRFYPYRVLLGP